MRACAQHGVLNMRPQDRSAAAHDAHFRVQVRALPAMLPATSACAPTSGVCSCKCSMLTLMRESGMQHKSHVPLGGYAKALADL